MQQHASPNFYMKQHRFFIKDQISLNGMNCSIRFNQLQMFSSVECRVAYLSQVAQLHENPSKETVGRQMPLSQYSKINRKTSEKA
jgi:hypothetical protein